ncbi:IS110 family transposase [Neorhizobium galegae]|uniref:IS110 family transposase n=1 Tax=Neorhizobium galegae TaxID=399 RepID=UPI000622B13A|nr:IS110 family transposase [Neorhizobium galegae]KAB1120005.1 IS110 family transposase [Neorhizobium galegae]MCQ1810655.1 IS110 family transposase [Neorhizobium galegae]CDZ64798.1 Transposase IS116/IS110/IS902 family protein [Neorhizobium galegae bv. orientalis]
MGQIAIIGLDLAKSVFQVHAVDADRNTVLKKKLRRAEVLSFFAELPPCVIAMEACASSHYWARELEKLGHTSRIIPAQYVKPFVMRGKSDAVDAEAITVAAMQPNMRFLRAKSLDQQAIVVLVKTRAFLLRQRSNAVNSLRGQMAEFGVISRTGHANLKPLISVLRDEQDKRLPNAVRTALLAILNQIEALNDNIEALEKDIVAHGRTDDEIRRLRSVPGVGDIVASAIKAFVPDPAGFRSARHFASWLGLTPRSNSSGGKQSSGRISKMGNKDLRALLVMGACSTLRWVQKRGTDQSWAGRLLRRRPFKVTAVALANKTARIIWAILNKGGIYEAHPRSESV